MDAVFDPIISEIIQVISGLLVGALVWLVVQAARKVGVTVSLETQQKIEAFARRAVLSVEERAAAAVRTKAAAWSGPEKLEAAVTELMARVPRIDETEAKRIVQAVLPTVGLGATEVGKALRTAK